MYLDRTQSEKRRKKGYLDGKAAVSAIREDARADAS